MSDDLHLFHGARLDAQRLVPLLDHVFTTNIALQGRGQRPTPVCIWGLQGVGKSMIVEDYVKARGWGWAYCAPAQFEEMGDLHGLPERIETEKGARTAFAPPKWVPNQDGPGVLLLDDINRADDRILRGLMQLLQNFEMFSWKLPPKWQIVCTANPEGGDYSVTPMDDAMLTRMLHATMTFDVKAWAAWATRVGVDERGIAFALTYPEVITGKRTTPRSLTQFLDQIAPIEDLKEHIDMVRTLAASSLDDITVATFTSFVLDGLQELISPEQILDAPSWAPIETRIAKLARGEEDEKRVDRLSVICTRLFLTLTHPRYEPKKKHGENLVAFLLHEALPNDLRMSLHRDLLQDGSDDVKGMMRHRALAELMLDLL